MSIIKTGSVEKNNNIFLNNDVQKKSGFKNALNSTIGCFISSVKNKLDSINEMVCRKKSLEAAIQLLKPLILNQQIMIFQKNH